MICYNCGATLTRNPFCTNCGADVAKYKKIVCSANILYNEGLERASVRDLSGAISCLRQAIKLDKNNVDARNLLGLVYFEMGEYVAALNEWVISKNLRQSKNIADDYLSLLQNNPTKLDTYSQAVKKYNLALNYCYQGSIDLAVIQLKKVRSLNPKYVQALQLLSLIYLYSEQWEDARRELLKCQKIDVNNTVTLRYLREAESVLNMDDDNLDGKGKGLKRDGLRKKFDSDSETYTPSIHSEPKISSTVINVLIGIIVGVAVSYLLIIPAKVTSAKEGMDENLKAANEQIDAKSAEIAELQQNLKASQNQNEKLTTELEIYTGEDGTMTAMDNLLTAVKNYLDNPEASADIAASLDNIDSDTLNKASDSFVMVYEDLLSKVGGDVGSTYYDSGIKAYQNESYEDAIADLTKAYSYDNTNGDALYNLGNAYRKSGDTIQAIEIYMQVIEQFPDTEMATRSQQYINELNVD